MFLRRSVVDLFCSLKKRKKPIKDPLNQSSASLPAGSVILEVTSKEVTAGDDVTLRCVYKDRRSSTRSLAFKAKFYKDDALIGKEPTGEKILTSVSTSNTGSYSCEHPEHGRSPESWLTVGGKRVELRRK